MSAKQYIGSNISLISKADIRYLGILHSIDPTAATVSLENVRSMGSEGRKSKPEEEIAPSQTVYPFIVFRAADVKDLTVDNPRPQQAPLPVPGLDDPAIMSSSRPPPHVAQPQPQPQPPGYYGPPPQLGHHPMQQGPPGWNPYGPPPHMGMGGWNPYGPAPPMMHQPQQGPPQQQSSGHPHQNQPPPPPPGQNVTPSSLHTRGPLPAPPSQGRAHDGDTETIVGPKPTASPQGPRPAPASVVSGATAAPKGGSATTPQHVNGGSKSSTSQAAPSAKVDQGKAKTTKEDSKAQQSHVSTSVFAAPPTAMEMLTAQFGDVGVAKAKPSTPQNGTTSRGVAGHAHGKATPVQAGSRGTSGEAPTTGAATQATPVTQASQGQGGEQVRHPLPAVPRGGAAGATNGAGTGRRQSVGSQRGRGGGRGGRHATTSSAATPGDVGRARNDEAIGRDFDFVKSTTAFVPPTGDKSDLSGLDGGSATGGALYDKKKSFFDDISSEIKERGGDGNNHRGGGGGGGGGRGRGRGGSDRGAERELNQATFGDASLARLGALGAGYNGRGRGWGRGGGRGRGRGRGGRGSSGSAVASAA